MKFNLIRNALLVVGIAVCAFGVMPSVALSASRAGDQNSAAVFPPEAQPYGRSFAEWSAAWWQWAFSFRADAHPLLETAGCDAGQSGPVLFLGGSFVNTTVVRDCTVPAGKAIWFPVLNTECSTFEGPPFHGDDEAELRACAAAVTNTGMFATIDGVAVENLSNYRVQSPLYLFSAPDGGLFGDPVTDVQSVSDGVWLMLAPLSAGSTHTIHFGGTQAIADFPPLTLDVTYHISVLPSGRGRARIASEPGTVENGTWGLVKEIYR